MDGQIILPGDWVALSQSSALGPGLYSVQGSSDTCEDSDVRACVAGVLRKRETKTKSETRDSTVKKFAWVDYSSRRVSDGLLHALTVAQLRHTLALLTCVYQYWTPS